MQTFTLNRHSLYSALMPQSIAGMSKLWARVYMGVLGSGVVLL